MEFLSEYGLFLAKVLTIVVAILTVLAGTFILSARGRSAPKEHIEVKNLNREFELRALLLQSAMLPRKEFKRVVKERKKRDKLKNKSAGAEGRAHRRRLFVLNFHGDIRATAVSALREEISALLSVAQTGDEVMLRLESGGGLVHAYGLAAAQLIRIKQRELPLTVAVDKVAASGGYMMACVADRIIAAPFAVLGSIGVISQLPNFNRVLRKNDIDFEQFTAGQYKRTVTVFGENSDQAKVKHQADIDDTHQLFQDFVAAQRSDLDMERVATGEHWYGTRALERNLVDELRTSDDFLLEASEEADLYEVTFSARKPVLARLFASAARAWLGRNPQQSELSQFERIV